jgi:uncharacterized protein
MAHRVVHFEIPAERPEELSSFYSDLFGWKIQKAESFDYWLCDTGQGDGINGAIMNRQTPEQSTTNYVGVDSVDEYAAKVAELGGQVVVSRQAVQGMGWFAVGLDPQGNLFGLWQNDANAA